MVAFRSSENAVLVVVMVKVVLTTTMALLLTEETGTVAWPTGTIIMAMLASLFCKGLWSCCFHASLSANRRHSQQCTMSVGRFKQAIA